MSRFLVSYDRTKKIVEDTELNAAYLESIIKKDQTRLEIALKRLFPKADTVFIRPALTGDGDA
jgi:hypothetical protein